MLVMRFDFPMLRGSSRNVPQRSGCMVHFYGDKAEHLPESVGYSDSLFAHGSMAARTTDMGDTGIGVLDMVAVHLFPGATRLLLVDFTIRAPERRSGREGLGDDGEVPEGFYMGRYDGDPDGTCVDCGETCASNENGKSG
jgi:hypothetical protein